MAERPSLLREGAVQAAVEGRFLDAAISVREAAMELVGNYVTTDPELANQVRPGHAPPCGHWGGTGGRRRRGKAGLVVAEYCRSAKGSN